VGDGEPETQDSEEKSPMTGKAILTNVGYTILSFIATLVIFGIPLFIITKRKKKSKKPKKKNSRTKRKKTKPK